MPSRTEAVERAEAYYDSAEADAFYKTIWGGQDIHIGLYQGDDEPIADASRRTVEAMAQRLGLKAGTAVSTRRVASRLASRTSLPTRLALR